MRSRFGQTRRKRLTIGAIAVLLIGALTVVGLAIAGTFNSSSPSSSPVIAVSNTAPLAKGAPSAPIGSQLRALIRKLGKSGVDSKVKSVEIVPTTLARAKAANGDSPAHGRLGARPVYLVVRHGSFSCEHTCPAPTGLKFTGPPNSAETLIVDATTNDVVETGLGGLDLVGLGPVTKVTNLPR
jgi:hypothetical protein